LPQREASIGGLSQGRLNLPPRPSHGTPGGSTMIAAWEQPSMISALALSVAMAATSVPPGWAPDGPIAPVVQVFERKPIDAYRRGQWLGYTAELDFHWKRYRAAGSTPEAWAAYVQAAQAAKRQYVYDDPYYVPIDFNPPPYLPAWRTIFR
jgi:hypothetical protein